MNNLGRSSPARPHSASTLNREGFLMPAYQTITEVTFSCQVCGHTCTERRTRRRLIGVTCRLCRSTRRKRYYQVNAVAARAYTSQWRKNNPQRAKEAVEKWHKDPANRERMRDYHHEYYLANKEAHNARGRKQYRDDPEKWKRQSREWVEKNPDRVLRTAAAWRRNNPENVRAISERRRAGQAVGRFTASDIQSLLNIQRGTCAAPKCSADLMAGYHIDHVMPLA